MVEAAPVALSVSVLLLLPRRRKAVTRRRKSNLVAINYAIYASYVTAPCHYAYEPHLRNESYHASRGQHVYFVNSVLPIL